MFESTWFYDLQLLMQNHMSILGIPVFKESLNIVHECQTIIILPGNVVRSLNEFNMIFSVTIAFSHGIIGWSNILP